MSSPYLLPPKDHYHDPDDQALAISHTQNNAPTYVAISILSFVLTKQLLRQVAPREAKCQGPTTVWKWVNTANSLVHSFVTGVGAVFCVYLYPRVAENVISTYSDFSHRLVSYSVGYFIFDFMDMAVNHRKRSSYELMAHHIFVLSCFTLSIYTRYYLAFTIISLVVEVNSIFLHWRQLLVITHTPKCTVLYRSVSLVNLITFVVFRIFTLAWMTRWLVLNKILVSPFPYAVGCISIFVLMLMSIVLFFRLLKSDFHYSSCCTEENYGEHFASCKCGHAPPKNTPLHSSSNTTSTNNGVNNNNKKVE